MKLRLVWSEIRDATELVRTGKAGRVDSPTESGKHPFKVYKVTGGIVRIDILPEEESSGKSGR